MTKMKMKTARWLSAGTALVTILCGGAIYLFPQMASPLQWALSILAILFAVGTVWILAKFHRCPNCGKFVPITGNYPTCIHCDAPIRKQKVKKEDPEA